MDGEKPQGESGNKGWLKALALLEVGGFELVFVLVFLILFFGTLNYFNLLSLSTIYPNQLGFLPHRPLQQTPQKTPTPSPTPEFLSNPLVAKAKAIGYNIIWMDPNDTVGRTVFYDWRGPYGNGGIGPKEIKNPDGTTYIRHITGLFQGLQDIPGSKDKYLILKNPQNGSFLPLIRVILDTGEASTTSAELTRFNLINLFVEDLDGLARELTPQGNSLGWLHQWQDNDLERILNQGDALTALLVSKKNINITDNGNNFAAASLYLRRFGGKEQLEKELGRPI